MKATDNKATRHLDRTGATPERRTDRKVCRPIPTSQEDESA